jgi:hypothetical protein
VARFSNTNPQVLRFMISLLRKESSFSQLEPLSPAMLAGLEGTLNLTETPA